MCADGRERRYGDAQALAVAVHRTCVPERSSDATLVPGWVMRSVEIGAKRALTARYRAALGTDSSQSCWCASTRRPAREAGEGRL